MSSIHATLREPDAPRMPLGRRGSADLSGSVLAGRYTLLRRIAAGGMATVYEAAAPHSSARLAIKVLDPVQADVLLIFAALPTASTAYVLAARMGYDAPYVAALVTVSTLAAWGSLSLALTVLR